MILLRIKEDIWIALPPPNLDLLVGNSRPLKIHTTRVKDWTSPTPTNPHLDTRVSVVPLAVVQRPYTRPSSSVLGVNRSPIQILYKGPHESELW